MDSTKQHSDTSQCIFHVDIIYRAEKGLTLGQTLFLTKDVKKTISTARINFLLLELTGMNVLLTTSCQRMTCLQKPPRDRTLLETTSSIIFSYVASKLVQSFSNFDLTGAIWYMH